DPVERQRRLVDRPLATRTAREHVAAHQVLGEVGGGPERPEGRNDSHRLLARAGVERGRRRPTQLDHVHLAALRRDAHHGPARPAVACPSSSVHHSRARSRSPKRGMSRYIAKPTHSRLLRSNTDGSASWLWSWSTSSSGSKTTRWPSVSQCQAHSLSSVPGMS